jgi:biopolymer transport protein ExbD
MKMKFKTNLKASNSLIDLTPLVDVIFLLLIFFIITSDILPLKSLNIQNPTLNKDSLPLTTQLLVVMDAQNVIYVGSKKAIVDMNSIKDKLNEEMDHLKKEHPGYLPSIVLSVDKRVDYGSFLRLFSTAQELGTHIRLVYKNNEEEEGYF